MSQGIRSWIRGLLKVPRETVGRTLSKTRSKNQSISQGAMPDSSEGAAGHCCQDTVQGIMPWSSGSCWKLERKIEIQLQTTRMDHHNLQVTDYGHVKKVFTNRRRKLNRTEDDEMFNPETNVLIWRRFKSTKNSAIHLGLNYDRYVIACQNHNFQGIKTLFDISLGLNFTKNSVEILSLSTTM